jgi:hypothetical protein
MGGVLGAFDVGGAAWAAGEPVVCWLTGVLTCGAGLGAVAGPAGRALDDLMSFAEGGRP